MPSISNAAELSDAQRQAVVNVLKNIIEDGNQKGYLRYSQDHRTSGYNWQKVKSTSPQSTVSSWSLTSADQQRVLAALKQDVATRYPNNEEVIERVASMTSLRQTKFKCRTLGAQVSDTISFDCSSLSSAAFSYAFGTSFIYCSGDFRNSSLFKTIPVSQAKPGDVLWHQGHVVVYLGQCYNGDVSKSATEQSTTYCAEAGGFTAAKGKTTETSKALADWLIAHPTAIMGHPNYKAQMPTVQLPLDCVRGVRNQVVIRKVNINGGEFKEAYTYVGEVKPGRAIDVSATTTSNNGNMAASGGESSGNGTAVSESSTVGGLSVEQVNNTKIQIGTRTTSLEYWPENLKLEDQALINSDGYFHKGTPAYGGYQKTVTTLEWLLTKASNMLDWLAGFITMGLKMQVVGWTAIVENAVSNGLAWGTQDMSGVPVGSGSTSNLNNAALSTQNVNGTQVNSGATSTINNLAFGLPIVTTEKVTVEDIIFNNVPLLDINFFNFSQAAGQQLSENSIIYNIRSLIATWYYIFRIIAIILLLVILIYNVVKMIVTTAVAEKVNAKEKVKDWLVAFMIVMAMHYFMIAVVNVNNQLVEVFEPKNTSVIHTTNQEGVEATFAEDINNKSITQSNEESLYEQIRVLAYDVQATTGWAGAIMYTIMVIYLFMFLVLYVKRLFIVAILTVTAPLVGALYAINKKTYPINNWFKEYTYNVLIQLIHALIYTVLVAVALGLAKTSSILGGIIALLIIGFIFSAETIVKKIFGYNSKELGGLSDSLAGQFAIYVGAKKLTSSLGAGTKNTVIKTKQFINEHTSKEKIVEMQKEKAKQQEVLDKIYEEKISTAKASIAILGQTVKDLYNSATSTTDYKGDYLSRLSEYKKKTGQNYKKLYQKYLKEAQLKTYKGSPEWQEIAQTIKKDASQARSDFISKRTRVLTNSVIATAGMTIGIPLLFIDKTNGIAVTLAGLNSFRRAFKRQRISGIKSYQHDLKGKKLLFFTASPVLAPAYANAIENGLEEREVYKTTYGDALDSLEKARKVEFQILEKIKQMYEEEENEEKLNEIETYRLTTTTQQNAKNQNIDNQHNETLQNSSNQNDNNTNGTVQNQDKNNINGTVQNIQNQNNNNTNETLQGQTNQNMVYSKVNGSKGINNNSNTKNHRNVTEKLNILRQEVLASEGRDFTKAVDKVLPNVTENDVQAIINAYMKENKINRISRKDFNNIRERMNRKLAENGKNVEISDSFTNNIREQVRKDRGMNKQVEKTVITKDGEQKIELKAKLEMKDITKICKQVAKDNKTKVNDNVITEMIMELKKDKSFRAVMTTQNTEQIVEKVKDKLEEKVKNSELTEKFFHAFEKKMDKHIEQKTKIEEKKVDQIIDSLDKKKAVVLLTKAINTEGGMKVNEMDPRYKDLLQDVRKLDELNKTYESLTGNKIYENVADLVEEFRKEILYKRGITNAKV